MLGIATCIAIDSGTTSGGGGDRGGGGDGPQGFRSTWETSNISTGSSAADTITLPLTASGTYDFVITWGDGNSETITSAAQATHTYASPGQYDITVFGDIVDWSFNNTGDKLKILNVSNWGSFTTGASAHWFYGCANMECTATDTLTQGSTSMYQAFSGCSSLATIDVSGWDVADVTNMNEAFMSCSSVTTLDVSSWNTGVCTGMQRLFSGCSVVSALDVSSWNTSSATRMDYMFQDANALTALDVSSWNTSSLLRCPWMFYGLNVSTLDVTNWDVDDVTDMEGMFFRSDITSIDVSNWNTSNVTEMRQLFDECTLLTSITWPSSGSLDTSSATDLRGFFCFTTALPSRAYASMRHWDITQATGTGALSGILTNTVNTLTFGEYNQILATWNAANTSNMTADFALAVATRAGITNRDAMISRGWTINDAT